MNKKDLQKLVDYVINKKRNREAKEKGERDFRSTKASESRGKPGLIFLEVPELLGLWKIFQQMQQEISIT